MARKTAMAGKRRGRVAAVVRACAAGAVLLIVSAGCSSSGGTAAGAVKQADAQSVAAGLARAAAAHGVCYGWQLLDGSTLVSAGSNLGAGVKVTDQPDKCPRYIEVRGTYRWYPETSESEDYARYAIVGNTSRATIDPAGLERLGAGTARLLDDPPATILAAAEVLPLLAQEAGAVTGVVPEPSASGSPLPLAPGGNDFLRGRLVLLVVSGSLLLAAIGTLVLGIVLTRRRDAATEKPEQPGKPEPSGAT